jgi:hypothetical protein
MWKGWHRERTRLDLEVELLKGRPNMSVESVTSDFASGLRDMSTPDERSLERAARSEWVGAKESTGVEREVHLFWCKTFAETYMNRRRERLDGIR